MNASIARAVVSTLAPVLKERRLARMKEIVSMRRCDVELVLENLVDDANAVGLPSSNLLATACSPARFYLHIYDAYGVLI